MAAVIYMRSAFQVIWLLGAIALLLAVSKRRRLVLSCCAVPLLAVALLYAKNEILFGVPTTSSWMGMNLARTTTICSRR